MQACCLRTTCMGSSRNTHIYEDFLASGPITAQESVFILSISIDMRTFCNLVGEALRQGPPEFVERLSPWIIAVLGAAMLGIMTYAWWPN